MSSNLIPLAISMIMGMQLIVAILLITNKNNVKTSTSYIIGVTIAIFTGTLIFYYFSGKFHPTKISHLDETTIHTIQIILVCILILLSIKTYINRKKVKPPTWFVKLETISVKGAFEVGLMVVFLLPGELMIMFTTALEIAHTHGGIIDILYFTILSCFLVSIPLLTYLLLGKKAHEEMPKIKEWLDKHSWVISIISYMVFIYMILSS